MNEPVSNTDELTREQKIAEIRERVNLSNQHSIKYGLPNDDVQVLLSEIDRLQQERDKAVEGLTMFAERDPYATSAKAKRILAELGVAFDE